MIKNTIKTAWQCGCPKCGFAPIFPHKMTLDVSDTCLQCGLQLKDHDSGDGPAVFLIFILGTLFVPLALLLDAYLPMTLWMHAIIWTVIALIICFGTMQPLKAYVIALNYKYRDGAHGV